MLVKGGPSRYTVMISAWDFVTLAKNTAWNCYVNKTNQNTIYLTMEVSTYMNISPHIQVKQNLEYETGWT